VEVDVFEIEQEIQPNHAIDARSGQAPRNYDFEVRHG